MLEAGLALIACCLPTLKSLITKQGLQSAVNSVRSAVSLHSINPASSHGSTGSRNIKAGNGYAMFEHGASDTGPLRPDDTIEMTNNTTTGEELDPTPEPGQIRVRKDIDITG